MGSLELQLRSVFHDASSVVLGPTLSFFSRSSMRCKLLERPRAWGWIISCMMKVL